MLRYVLRNELAAYLRVDTSTIGTWHTRRVLIGESRPGYQMRFTEDAINAFLAHPQRARGFAAPPTIADIRDGVVDLITVREAQIILPLPQHRWATLCRRGEIASLNLSHSLVRLDLRSVRAYVAKYHAGLAYEQVLHIVGPSPKGFKRVVQMGILETINNFHRINHALVSRDSLLQQLAQWIVTDIQPDDWLDQRESTEEDLLSTEATASLLGRCVDEVHMLVKSNKLHAINPFGTKDIFRIDPESVRAYQEHVIPLGLDELARIFGVTAYTISRWLYSDESLACPIHQHDTVNHMQRWCLCAYLESRCSPAITPARWISQCLRPTAGPLWTEAKAAAKLNWPLAKLREMREAGKLKAVMRPSGIWVYRSSQIRHLLHKIRYS